MERVAAEVERSPPRSMTAIVKANQVTAALEKDTHKGETLISRCILKACQASMAAKAIRVTTILDPKANLMLTEVNTKK